MPSLSHGAQRSAADLTAIAGSLCLQVLVDERLAENSDRLGKILRSELQRIPSERITTVSLQR